MCNIRDKFVDKIMKKRVKIVLLPINLANVSGEMYHNVKIIFFVIEMYNSLVKEFADWLAKQVSMFH